MFELDEALRAWRRELQLDGQVTEAETDELEDHAREIMQSLPVSSLSERERFTVAMTRLGATGSLRSEFAAEDPGAVWRRRIALMLGGYLIVSSLRVFLHAIGQSLSIVLLGQSVSAQAWALLYTSTILVGFSSLVLLGWQLASGGAPRASAYLEDRARRLGSPRGFALVSGAVLLTCAAGPAWIGFVQGVLFDQWSRAQDQAAMSAFIRVHGVENLALPALAILAVGALGRTKAKRARQAA